MSITVREKLILKQEEIEYGIQENEAVFLGMLYMNGKVGRWRLMLNRKRKVLDDLTAVVDEYYTNDLEDDVSDTETKSDDDTGEKNGAIFKWPLFPSATTLETRLEHSERHRFGPNQDSRDSDQMIEQQEEQDVSKKQDFGDMHAAVVQQEMHGLWK
ncbi:hypothetical protein GOP47_0009746 [Adiantum capillus-veneris]|uniref:Uncharacterized protein n=1 Tax=Adiantum capillus-veneris TaxID=13818 RepID=A0A9D4ZJY7_ADICA|nr:hypothetical protein GOP47_0009746 [Adiantum capillus-veneris]